MKVKKYVGEISVIAGDRNWLVPFTCHYGNPPKGWDPGADDEVEFIGFVTEDIGIGPSERFDFDDFVEAFGLSKAAVQKIEDDAVQQALDDHPEPLDYDY